MIFSYTIATFKVFVLCILVTLIPLVFGENSQNRKTYVVRYKNGESTIPVTVVLDYHKQAEYVINTNSRSPTKSVTFYDFKQHSIAYKDMTNKECFIGRLANETLQEEDKHLEAIENPVISNSVVLTLNSARLSLTPTEVKNIAGQKIAVFCRKMAAWALLDKDVHKRSKRQSEHAYGHQSGHQGHHAAYRRQNVSRRSHRKIRAQIWPRNSNIGHNAHHNSHLTNHYHHPRIGSPSEGNNRNRLQVQRNLNQRRHVPAYHVPSNIVPSASLNTVGINHHDPWGRKVYPLSTIENTRTIQTRHGFRDNPRILPRPGFANGQIGINSPVDIYPPETNLHEIPLQVQHSGNPHHGSLPINFSKQWVHPLRKPKQPIHNASETTFPLHSSKDIVGIPTHHNIQVNAGRVNNDDTNSNRKLSFGNSFEVAPEKLIDNTNKVASNIINDRIQYYSEHSSGNVIESEEQNKNYPPANNNDPPHTEKTHSKILNEVGITNDLPESKHLQGTSETINEPDVDYLRPTSLLPNKQDDSFRESDFKVGSNTSTTTTVEPSIIPHPPVRFLNVSYPNDPLKYVTVKSNAPQPDRFKNVLKLFTPDEIVIDVGNIPREISSSFAAHSQPTVEHTHIKTSSADTLVRNSNQYHHTPGTLTSHQNSNQYKEYYRSHDTSISTNIEPRQRSSPQINTGMKLDTLPPGISMYPRHPQAPFADFASPEVHRTLMNSYPQDSDQTDRFRHHQRHRRRKHHTPCCQRQISPTVTNCCSNKCCSSRNHHRPQFAPCCHRRTSSQPIAPTHISTQSFGTPFKTDVEDECKKKKMCRTLYQSTQPVLVCRNPHVPGC